MRGRKPKPTALKVLDGTRKDRINSEEPTFDACDLKPPAILTADAEIEHWNELAPLLAKAGVLTVADRPMLAILCRCFGRLELDPLDDKAIDQYRRIAVEFGLTPSSRSRLKFVGDAKPKDELGAFLARKKTS